MEFDIDRWIGRSEKPNVRSRARLSNRNCQRDSRPYEIKLPQLKGEPNVMADTIVGALDRDSMLRHKCLTKRWQGIIF
jgi:hypothetical protein